MLLFDLAATSRRVTETSSRLEKVEHLSACLRRLEPNEFDIGVAYLIQPMPARTAEDLSDALNRLGTVGLEWKPDGARVQVHKAGQDIRVFRRRLN